MTVYFIRDVRGRVKIGHSEDPISRLSQLQVGSAELLEIIRLADGGAAAERWLHRRYADRSVRGEWFTFTAEMMTVRIPDEVPCAAHTIERFRSTADYLRAADGLGILTDDLRRSLAGTF